MRIQLFACLLAFVVGCGGAAHPTVAPTADVAAPSTPELVVGGPPAVRLLDPGAAPLAPLRYRLAVGTMGRGTVELHLTMSISVNGQEMPMPGLPASRATVKTEVISVDADGNAHIGYAIETMEVMDADQFDPAAVAAVEEQYRALGTMHGSMDVSTRGVCTNMQLALPADADEVMRMIVDDIRKSMSQITAVLPEEPVGVGATWEARARVNMRGVDVDQTSIFSLDQRDADSANLRIHVTQHAGQTAMNLPNLPAGTEAVVDSLESNGSAETLLPFTNLVPTSELTMHTNMTARITSGRDSQAMGMRLESVARYFPLAAE